MDKAAKRLRIPALFPFILSPLFAWGSVIASDESAVFASLSRMIWFSGSALRIFIAMLVLAISGLITIYVKQRSGLHAKRHDRGIFVYQNLYNH